MALPVDEKRWRQMRASPYRLRFELNTGGSYVSMFTSAYDRARALARAALPSSTLIAVIAASADPWDQPWAVERYGPKRESAFDALRDLGVSASEPLASWHGWLYPSLESEEAASEHRAFNVSWNEADGLLWSNIAREIGIRPTAPVLAVLADFERGVSVYAYDDRGMDISAVSREEIAGLYSEFDPWLLDYDRPRMADVFSSNSR